MTDKELKMSFDPKTIEHLGIKMYSRLPNAIAELIANAYDACATEVIVHLYDEDPDKKSIIVEDDGIGMTFDEVNDKFLRIGRNRREEEEAELPCGRMVTGKKGLGKLAFFGIGEIIQVETCKDGEKTTFTLNWEKLLDTPSGEDYCPDSFTEKCDEEAHGTTITLTKLKRKTSFDFDSLAKSLAKLFNFQDAFVVLLAQNNDHDIIIDNKLKYEGIEPEFKWPFPQATSELLESEYQHKNNIAGEIVTTDKPIKPDMRGVTLFANGRMVNKSEFFGRSESSHFFSYATGWLNIDFVDNWKEDVISTNRQSLDWENSQTAELRIYLREIINSIHTDWRKKKKEKKRASIDEKTSVNIQNWYTKIPNDIQAKVEPVINKIIDDAQLSEPETNNIVKTFHELLPEYTYYHYRYIHPEIQKISETYYQNGDYYTAFSESLKRYVAEVRKKSNSNNPKDRSLMQEVFQRKLLVTLKYKKTDGTPFLKDTIENIEAGQQFLSEGVVAGGRNPLAHEEHLELSRSGLFSEKDCLDFLSLLSHLFKRLDDAKSPTDA